MPDRRRTHSGAVGTPAPADAHPGQHPTMSAHTPAKNYRNIAPHVTLAIFVKLRRSAIR